MREGLLGAKRIGIAIFENTTDHFEGNWYAVQ